MTSQQFQTLLQAFGIIHRTTPAYTPQCNPVEQANRTLKSMISHTLFAPKVGPLEVRKILPPVIVDLRDARGRWHRHVHVQDLKPAPTDTDKPTEPEEYRDTPLPYPQPSNCSFVRYRQFSPSPLGGAHHAGFFDSQDLTGPQ
ncbi:reverse ribonuclease integrase [Lasius niger]|uniref:Reverse ribonuclease integrase n=1 Tax=Lasius niger TaxID=67767 RepID=A0A0J7KBL1_LASNI|nr:reverse ribonuclease integrase [Lasius niger]